MAPQVCRSLRYKDPLCIRPCQCPYCIRSHYLWVLETAVLRRSWKCAEASIVDLWVMKIKKPMILCVRSMSVDHVNRAQNADHAARTCERFVYSRVKMTRLYDYQTWQTHFGGNSRCAQRFVGFYFLVVLFGCWLAGRANSYAEASD